MINPRHLQQLPEALAPAYEALDKDPRYQELQPWRRPLCSLWANHALPLARTALSGSGADIQRIVFNGEVEVPDIDTPLFAYHEYIADTSDPDDPMVVDGTWLQFSQAEDTSDAPPVLVARASEIPLYLREAGISEDYSVLWRPQIPADPDGPFHIGS